MFTFPSSALHSNVVVWLFIDMNIISTVMCKKFLQLRAFMLRETMHLHIYVHASVAKRMGHELTRKA